MNIATAPIFFECVDCGFLHPLGHDTECRDVRFTPEELDGKYGVGKWQEIETGIEAPVVASVQNLNRLLQITATTDLEGNTLEPGCSVRVFDFYVYDQESDSFHGINTLGERVSYVEGVLTQVDESAGRYVIELKSEVCKLLAKSISRPVAGSCQPPLNGTMTTMGWPTFGVFRIK